MNFLCRRHLRKRLKISDNIIQSWENNGLIAGEPYGKEIAFNRDDLNIFAVQNPEFFTDFDTDLLRLVFNREAIHKIKSLGISHNRLSALTGIHTTKIIYLAKNKGLKHYKGSRHARTLPVYCFKISDLEDFAKQNPWHFLGIERDRLKSVFGDSDIVDYLCCNFPPPRRTRRRSQLPRNGVAVQCVER